MRKQDYHQIVPSTMKVVASTDLNIEEDLKKDNNKVNKSISELLNEQEKAEANEDIR